MPDLGKAVYTISVDRSEVKRNLAEVERDVQRSTTKVEKSFTRADAAVSRMAGSIGATGTAATKAAQGAETVGAAYTAAGDKAARSMRQLSKMTAEGAAAAKRQGQAAADAGAKTEQASRKTATSASRARDSVDRLASAYNTVRVASTQANAAAAAGALRSAAAVRELTGAYRIATAAQADLAAGAAAVSSAHVFAPLLDDVRRVKREVTETQRQLKAMPKVKSPFEGFGGYMAGKGSTTASHVGQFAGLAAVYGIIKGGREDVKETDIALAKVDARLEKLGKSTGITASHLQDLGQHWQKLAGIQDEVVIGAGAVLLTFQNVQNMVGKGNNIFDQAVGAAANLSKAFGGSLNSNVLLVGRALNDPIKGLTRLERKGIQFTASQKAMIKSLVETGRGVEAQKIILDVLEKKVGKTAEAYGKTLTGRLDIAKAALEDQAGVMLTSLIPAFTAFVEVLSGVGSFLSKHTTLMKAALGVYIGWKAAQVGFAIVTKTSAAAVKLLEAANWLLVRSSKAATTSLGEQAAAERLAGSSATGAAGKVGKLRGALGALGKLGVIGLTVEVAFHSKGIANWMRKVVDPDKTTPDWLWTIGGIKDAVTGGGNNKPLVKPQAVKVSPLMKSTFKWLADQKVTFKETPTGDVVAVNGRGTVYHTFRRAKGGQSFAAALHRAEMSPAAQREAAEAMKKSLGREASYTKNGELPTTAGVNERLRDGKGTSVFGGRFATMEAALSKAKRQGSLKRQKAIYKQEIDYLQALVQSGTLSADDLKKVNKKLDTLYGKYRTASKALESKLSNQFDAELEHRDRLFSIAQSRAGRQGKNPLIKVLVERKRYLLGLIRSGKLSLDQVDQYEAEVSSIEDQLTSLRTPDKKKPKKPKKMTLDALLGARWDNLEILRIKARANSYLSDDRKVLLAEREYLQGLLKNGIANAELKRGVQKKLAKVKSDIVALDRKIKKAARSDKDPAKNDKDNDPLLWTPGMRTRLAIAQRDEDLKNDFAIYDAEEKYLWRLLDRFKKGTDAYAQINEELTNVIKEKKRLKEEMAGTLSEEASPADVARAFYSTRSSFFSSFGSDVFSTLPSGLRLPGNMGFRTGGVVPGRGRGDTVPAMLTPGEVVLNRKQIAGASRAMGVPNSPHAVFGAVQRFEDGGVVQGPGAHPKSGAFASLPIDEQRRRIIAGYQAGRMSKSQAEAALKFWSLGKLNEGGQGLLSRVVSSPITSARTLSAGNPIYSSPMIGKQARLAKMAVESQLPPESAWLLPLYLLAATDAIGYASSDLSHLGKAVPKNRAISPTLRNLYKDVIVPDGGGTRAKNWKSVLGDKGYVAAYGAYEKVIPAANFTTADLKAYRRAHMKLLKSNPNMRIGLWHNPEDNNIYLDISRYFRKKSKAMKFAKHEGQLAILDIAALNRADYDNAFPTTGLGYEKAAAIKARIKAQHAATGTMPRYKTWNPSKVKAYAKVAGKRVASEERGELNANPLDWIARLYRGGVDSFQAGDLDQQLSKAAAGNMKWWETGAKDEAKYALGAAMQGSDFITVHRGNELRGMGSFGMNKWGDEIHVGDVGGVHGGGMQVMKRIIQEAVEKNVDMVQWASTYYARPFYEAMGAIYDEGTGMFHIDRQMIANMAKDPYYYRRLQRAAGKQARTEGTRHPWFTGGAGQIGERLVRGERGELGLVTPRTQGYGMSKMVYKSLLKKYLVANADYGPRRKALGLQSGSAAALKLKENVLIEHGLDPNLDTHLGQHLIQQFVKENKGAGALTGIAGFDDAFSIPGIRRELSKRGYKKIPKSLQGKDFNMAIERLRVLSALGADAHTRSWYARAGGVIKDTADKLGMPIDKVAQTFAIFSQGSNPTLNFDYAVKALEGYQKTGGFVRTGRYPGEQGRKFLDVMMGKGWSGRKTNSYYGNMLKYADPAAFKRENIPGDELVTVDRHVAGSFVGKEVPSAAEYEIIKEVFRIVADKLGWAPEELQAAMWVPYKSMGKSVREALKGKPVPGWRKYMDASNDAYEFAFGKKFGAPTKHARGGIVRGTGTGDTQRAWLTPGEMVLNRAQQRRLFTLLDTGNSSTASGQTLNAEIHQHFLSPPSDDGHREARMALNAIKAQFDG